MTPSEALQHIPTLVKTSAELKDDTQRKVLLRGVAWRRMVLRNVPLTS
jgi:hypothetical protein